LPIATFSYKLSITICLGFLPVKMAEGSNLARIPAMINVFHALDDPDAVQARKCFEYAQKRIPL
jgi:hypothetical protein